MAGREAQYDMQIKLLLIGDTNVGKTCLLLRYVNNSYSPTFIVTIGIDFKTKIIQLDGKRIKLQIWDTAGMERFRTITTSYFRGAHGILLVYDVNDRETFNNIRRWFALIQMHADVNVNMILIGNRCDIDDHRVVTTADGEALAKEYNIPFFETSSKYDLHVDEAFIAIATDVKNRLVGKVDSGQPVRGGQTRIIGKADSGGQTRSVFSFLKKKENLEKEKAESQATSNNQSNVQLKQQTKEMKKAADVKNRLMNQSTSGQPACDLTLNCRTQGLKNDIVEKIENEMMKKESNTQLKEQATDKESDLKKKDIPSSTLCAWLKETVLHDKLDQLKDVCDIFKEKGDCDTLEDLLRGHEDFNHKFLREELKLSIVVTNRIVDEMAKARKNKMTNVRQGHIEHHVPSPSPPSSMTIISAKDLVMGRRLGKGGFGYVCLAEYDHQLVAVKCFGVSAMTQKNAEAIYNEVDIMRQLSHPCLVQLLGLVYDDREGSDDPPKLVMEFAPNGSLHSLLHSKREISWPDRHRIAADLARGLVYLHKKKVVHRDIKSLNVVLGEHMNAKWCDFGLSCLKEHSVESQSVVGSTEGSATSLVGTFRWMSPELLNRLTGRCFQSDIWALGMLYYELASRRIPFSDEPNEMAVRAWVMDGRGENVPDGCSSVLGDIMKDCWKERHLRPTAQQIEVSLKGAVMSSTVSSFSSSSLDGPVSHSGVMMKDSAMGSTQSSSMSAFS